MNSFFGVAVVTKRGRSISAALAIGLLFALAASGAQAQQHLLFRVRISELLLQAGSLAEEKAPSEFVEITLPVKLNPVPVKLAAVTKASAGWDTPLAAAASDFSANKADDPDWIVENFAPTGRPQVREMLSDKEIRARNSAVFRKRDARYVSGEANYQRYVLLFVCDGSISAEAKVITLEKTAKGLWFLTT